MNTIEFGQLIKLLRTQNNLTQEELAFQLGVTHSAVAKWEKGDHIPDISMFNKLSEILHVSYDDLHHPDKAIARLTTPASEADIPNLKAASTSSRKKWLVFSIVFILLFLAIVGICLYLHNSVDTEQDIIQVAYREIEDETINTAVCEIACVYTGDLDSITQESPFALLLLSDWQNNAELYPDINILKVSLYKERQCAMQWETPEKSFYLVR